MPCLHTFCGGCFSDWVSRQKDCPSCRVAVNEIKKNSLVNSLIENYLLLNPQLKREEAEIKELEEKNIFKNDLVKVDQIQNLLQKSKPQAPDAA